MTKVTAMQNRIWGWYVDKGRWGLMDIYQDVSKCLTLLKLNETQMSEEQFVQYAPELERLRKKIATGADQILCHFCLSGVLIPKSEPQPVINRICLNIQAVIDGEKSNGTIKNLYDILFQTYSLDNFLEAACDLKEKIIYQAYAPYWTDRCKKRQAPPGCGINGEAWYSTVIDMYWHDEFCIWVSASESAWCTCLPPLNK